MTKEAIMEKETDKYIFYSNGKVFSKIRNKFLNGSTDKDGYLIYQLGNKNRIKAHRLIALTFIPNPENKPQVNHLDGNKQNNDISNLEWVTNSENLKHAHKIGLMKNKKGKEDSQTKEIFVFNKEGELLFSCWGLKEAQKKTGIDWTAIAYQAGKKEKSVHATKNNFLFSHTKEIILKKPKGTKVKIIDNLKKEETIFESINEAAREMKMASSTITFLLTEKKISKKGIKVEYVE